MILFDLHPADAWFFRDSRPYHKGEFSQSAVNSIFPPYAPTVVGALRAGYARENGWDGRSEWNSSVKEILGDGFDNLGELSFFGPYLAVTIDGTQHQLFPLPRHILGLSTGNPKAPWKPQTFLRPGDHPITCDLGEVRLPVPEKDRDDLKNPRNAWVTADGLRSILRGELPGGEDIFFGSQLWKMERRIGLEREADSLVTGDGALYSPGLVRLEPGVTLRMGVSGLPDDWQNPQRFPLGGESRMALANIERRETLLPNGEIPNLEDIKGLTIISLSHLTLDSEERNPLKPDMVLEHEEWGPLQGCRLVSACIGDPVHIGGWDSLNHRPLPLRSYIPAGSTLFVELEDLSDAQKQVLIESQGAKIGARQAYGFGHIAIGAW